MNADGSLDSSFGTGGKAIIPMGNFDDSVISVIQQGDGKLVLGVRSYSFVNSYSDKYDYSIVRLNADGSLDSSFGTGGKAGIPMGNFSDVVTSVIQQADGKLVLGGYSSRDAGNSDYSIVRLNANGSLDSSFGTGGKAIFPVGNSNDEAFSVIQQADGKLVLGQCRSVKPERHFS